MFIGGSRFSAGPDRLVADSFGVDAVIVNGEIIREDGRDLLDADSHLPGTLLRKGAAAKQRSRMKAHRG